MTTSGSRLRLSSAYFSAMKFSATTFKTKSRSRF
eukprot:CAMPEP_0198648398 /NCGR_PEP_ID=MMETSP1467-20131203/3467_1 /TAXON_ID=1462469 /ORGANISM="unid. sp., Strain CCMP2135" /LENGTH=33 /DNA_ID= /DNA_START= /DNA_END= /DNA_ORIENTATION=